MMNSTRQFELFGETEIMDILNTSKANNFTLSRFSSPSQFSMSLAATMLEDQSFIKQFLSKSHSLLLQNRLLAEDLLRQAGIEFYDKGYGPVSPKKKIRSSDNLFLTISQTETQDYSSGSI